MSGGVDELVPINFERIEAGRLAEDLDHAIEETASRFLTHIHRFGIAETKKAKAKIKLEIEFENEGTTQGDFKIRGKISTQIPGRPVSETRALRDVTKAGEEVLVVRGGGSDAETPAQNRFAFAGEAVADVVAEESKHDEGEDGAVAAPVAPGPKARARKEAL